jgi:ribose 5-phosphate isomerase A
MTNQDELKRTVARAAINHVPRGEIIGVGTGSTADLFIDELGAIRGEIRGAVASSERSARRLAAAGIPLFGLNEVEALAVYIDGADEIDHGFSMIKGGGGALTRERSSRQSRIPSSPSLTEQAGRCARPLSLPVEVIPIARHRSCAGCRTRWHAAVARGFQTDNGNLILDVHGLRITDAPALERQIDGIVKRRDQRAFRLPWADVLLLRDA